jgi:small GTP-binding protein
MDATPLDFPGAKVILTVVDIGGQETFSALRGRFFAGAHHMILVFDKTNRSTFEEIPEWYDTLSEQFGVAGNKFLNGSLVGNKADIEDKQEVTTLEAERLAKVLTLEYFDTSAKTGLNVAELFLHAAESSRLASRSTD